MKAGRPYLAKIAPLPVGASAAGSLLLAVLLLLAGCASPPADEPAENPEAPSAETSEEPVAEESPVDLYTVRGEVVELHVDKDPRGFVVHHEAIDDFEGITGEVWGMDAMTMPFLISDEVTLDEVAEGDKVRFTLRVDWSDDDMPQVVTAVEKLPADTELEFRPARPPGSDEEPASD